MPLILKSRILNRRKQRALVITFDEATDKEYRRFHDDFMTMLRIKMGVIVSSLQCKNG